MGYVLKKNSILSVKYEKETKVSCLRSPGRALIFSKFIKTIGFVQIGSNRLKVPGDKGFHPFQNILKGHLVLCPKHYSSKKGGGKVKKIY
jgi:hypothetical protein